MRLGVGSSASGGQLRVSLGGLLLNDHLEEGKEGTAGWQLAFASLYELARELALTVLDLGDTGDREADPLGESSDRQPCAEAQLAELGAKAGRRRAGWINLVGWSSSRQFSATSDGVNLHCSPPTEVFAVGRSIDEQSLLSLVDR
jgi:hypothetical protein